MKWCAPEMLRVIVLQIYLEKFIDLLQNSFIRRNTMVLRTVWLMPVMQVLALTTVYLK
jgi:hypothetical protein